MRAAIWQQLCGLHHAVGPCGKVSSQGQRLSLRNILRGIGLRVIRGLRTVRRDFQRKCTCPGFGCRLPLALLSPTHANLLSQSCFGKESERSVALVDGLATLIDTHVVLLDDHATRLAEAG